MSKVKVKKNGFKVCITPSNQPENEYAYGNTNEHDQCAKIADAARVALERCGFEALVVQDCTLAEKVAQSNKFKADLHTPIHTNSYNGKVGGTRMFCYQFGGKGYEACKAIFNLLAPLSPGTSENIKENKDLYEIKNTTAPVAYIEFDFHDVPEIAKFIVENTELIGETIAHGICDYFGVEYVVPENTEKSKVEMNNAARIEIDKQLNIIKEAEAKIEGAEAKIREILNTI